MKLRRLCFYRCLSVNKGGVSQHALQVVSQHALQQVSRGCAIPAFIAGAIPACLATDLQGGLLPEGSAPGRVPAPGGGCSEGVCSWGCLLQGDSAFGRMPASGGCLLGGSASRWGCVETPQKKQTATVADSTHPAGMHSC